MSTSHDDTGSLAKCLLTATCGGCNNVYDGDDHQPRLLPCLHVVCLDCLSHLVADEHLVCSQCKSRHVVKNNDVTIFPRDQTKHELLELMKLRSGERSVLCDFCEEDAPAAFRCQTCNEYLCTECQGFHKRYKRYKGHSVVSIQSLTSSESPHQTLTDSPYCHVSKHDDEVLEMYCKQCARPICSKCALQDISAGHKIVQLDKVYEDSLKCLRSSESDLTYIRKSVESVTSLVQDEIKEVKRMSQEATKAATVALDECIGLLQKRKEQLLARIKFEEARKLDVLEEQEENLQNLKLGIDDGLLYMNEAVVHVSRPSFLAVAQTIQRRFNKLKGTKIDSGVNVNSAICFNPVNISDFDENILKDLGKIISTRAYAPNTRILAPQSSLLGETFSVMVQLRDRHSDVIDDEDVDVVVCLINDRGGILSASCQTQADDGTYKATFQPSSSGKYRVEVSVLGEQLNSEAVEIKVVQSSIETGGDDNEQPKRPISVKIPRSSRTSHAKQQQTSTGIKTSAITSTPRQRRNIDCPSVHFDESTQSSYCFLSDDKKKVSNTPTCAARRRPTMINRSSVHHGVAGSVSFTSPCKSYFQLGVSYTIYEDLKANDLICDVMLTEAELSDFVTAGRQIHLAYSFCVVFCGKCSQVCLECWNHDRLVDHYPIGVATAGSRVNKIYGFLVADDTKTIKMADITEGELLVTFVDVDFSKPIWPAFCLYGSEKVDVLLQLQTGNDIQTVPRNILVV